MSKRKARLMKLEQILAAYRRSGSGYDPDEPWLRAELPLAMHYLTETRNGAMSDDEYARRWPDNWQRLHEIMHPDIREPEPPRRSFFGRRL